MSADDAAAALKLARKKQTDGDDAGAMKMAQKSLRILESDEAQKLVDHIRKFGDDSEMAATARRIIEAADLYAGLQLAHDAESPPPPLSPEDVLWLAHTPLAARTAKSSGNEPPPYIAWGDPLCAVSAVPPVPRSLPRG